MIRITLVLFLVAATVSQAQTILDLKVEGNHQDKPLATFLTEFERSHDVRFYFMEEWLSPYLIETDVTSQSLGNLLSETLKNSDISWAQAHPNGIVFIKDPSYEMERRNSLTLAARDQKKIDKMVVGDPSNYKPGRMAILSGTVLNADSRAPLIGATVQANGASGATTDVNGKFELRLPEGEHVLSFGFVSFKEAVVDLTLNESGVILVPMEEAPVLLQEVVINAQPINELTSSRPGQLQLSVGAMKKQPSLLGEADLVRQLQVLPGVTVAGEAAAGFNVRGGSVDQNLVLYDGLPVFNTSHSLGFFSSFNSDAIREMNFYRGGIPAEYGGRISSVLDIRSKSGDPEKWRVNGGIGLISANLMVRGPIKKNKTTVAASLRTTYSDWFITLLNSNLVNLNNSKVNFYDGELRLDHSFNEKTKLTFSYYGSSDVLRVRGDTTFTWRNQLAMFRLDRIFSPRLSGTFQLGVGDYRYGVDDEVPANAFELTYHVTYPSLKADFLYSAGRHRIGFGLQSMYYVFNPGKLTPTNSESSVKSISMTTQNSLESGLYLSDAFSLSNRIVVEAGLRLSSFLTFGPSTQNVYEPGLPLTPDNIIDSVTYAPGEIISSNLGLEPRIALRYSLDERSSLKLSYHRIYQYLHLITNTTAITPVDVWQPTSQFFKPQMADQISLGYFRDFKEKKYEAFVETFYKTIDNVLDFKNGAQLILNKALETDLLQGTGLSYGVETYVAKNTGRLTWALSYTFSRSLRTIQGPTSSESINNGKTFPSNFDQPHIINYSWNYRISRRYSFTGNFQYRTGRPVTVPLYGIVIDGYTAAYFSDRNQFRIPDYHRLDIAFVLEGNHKLKKPWTGSWIISFLNVYGHRNAYTYFFNSDYPGRINTYQLSILGSVIPSVTYSFKF